MCRKLLCSRSIFPSYTIKRAYFLAVEIKGNLKCAIQGFAPVFFSPIPRPESEWKSGLVDVRIGLNDLQSLEETGNSANIAKVTIHPDYEEIAGGKEGVINDLAIVMLDRTVASPPVGLDTSRSRNKTAVILGFRQANLRKEGGRVESQLR